MENTHGANALSAVIQRTQIRDFKPTILAFKISKFKGLTPIVIRVKVELLGVFGH